MYRQRICYNPCMILSPLVPCSRFQLATKLSSEGSSGLIPALSSALPSALSLGDLHDGRSPNTNASNSSGAFYNNSGAAHGGGEQDLGKISVSSSASSCSGIPPL
jgi:hypothetical protein